MTQMDVASIALLADAAQRQVNVGSLVLLVDAATPLGNNAVAGAVVLLVDAVPEPESPPGPDAPTGLTATAISSSEIDLAWTDNASTETLYSIERSELPDSGFAEIDTVAADETSYSDTGLDADTTYYYRVRAYDGTNYSDYSDVASAATTTLEAPGNLTAAALGSSRIKIDWTDYSGAETLFSIERSTAVASGFAEIDTVAADVTTYTDSGLSASTTYYYRVRASDGSTYSGYSNTASATTLIAPSTMLASATNTQLDAQYRTFAGPLYSTLLTAGITASLATWTAPDTGKPAGWTEITSRVSWRSRLSMSKRRSSITWTADLQGTDYDSTYLGIGRAIVQWVRYWEPVGGWQAWQRDFVGQIVSRSDKDDYRHGKAWTRSITGTNASLDRFNAPHLTAGPLQIALGASVDVKDNDILSDVSLERDQGEFVGGVATIEPGNIVDGRTDSVFISNSTPGIGDPGISAPVEDGDCIISEVFFAPVAGYPLSQCWWVEVYNWRAQTEDMAFGLVSGKHVGGAYTFQYLGGWPERLTAGRFAVVCANRTVFEQYTGGAPGAEFVIDAGQYNANFTIDPTDGMVTCTGSPRGTIAWAPGGANRKYDDGEHSYWDTGSPTWSAAPTYDSGLIPAGSGYSIRRDLNQLGPLTGGNYPAPNPAVFSANPYPSPGDKSSNLGGVAIRIVLPENVCRLTNSITAASTRIPLDNYVGWPCEKAIYKGIVDGHVFRYVNRDNDGLIVLSWDNAPAGTIAATTRVYPYAPVYMGGVNSWAAQTGYPVFRTIAERSKLPYIQRFQQYWSYMADARQYQEDGWRADYHGLAAIASGGWHQPSIELRLWDAYNNTQYLWVRTILFVIDYMSDAGRAKLNEFRVDVPQVALGATGVPSFDGARSADLARWLVTTYYGLKTADFVDQSATNAHDLGTHSLAITAISQVLDDLARITGCLVYYGTDGKVYWLDDCRWPLGAMPAVQYTFSASSIRGEVQFSEQTTPVDYVIVNGMAADGTPCRAIYPSPPVGTEPPAGAQVEELSGFHVALASHLYYVAMAEWSRRRKTLTATWTVKGIGEWLRPGQVVRLQWDIQGLGVVDYMFEVESVERTRSLDGRWRQMRTTVHGRVR